MDEELFARIDAEARANLAKINKRTFWLEGFYRNALAFIERYKPRRRLAELYKIAERIKRDVGTDTACRHGCSMCCYQAVTITAEEAQLISKAINIPLADPTPMSYIVSEENAEMAALRERLTGVPCIFLKAGRCSIYAVRPLACRLHFNLSESNEICDTEKFGLIPVPYLDPNTMLAIACWHRPKFAEIRAWFPTIKEGGAA